MKTFWRDCEDTEQTLLICTINYYYYYYYYYHYYYYYYYYINIVHVIIYLLGYIVVEHLLGEIIKSGKNGATQIT